MREGSVRLRVMALIRCRPTAGRWLLAPVIEVRILAPELRIGCQAVRRTFAKRETWVRLPARCSTAHPVDPDSGLLNPLTGFDSLASYAFVRGRDPSLEARCAGSSPAGGTVARVVQRQGRRSFNAQTRVRFPSRVLLEGEVCAVQTPVLKTGRRASVRVRLLRLPRSIRHAAIRSRRARC